MAEQPASIEALLEEERTFPPSPEFVRQANINDPGVYEEAERDFEGFWSRFADELSWFRKWDSVLEWDPPHAKWFVGAKTNVSYNCVDRHLATRRNKAAIVWEGEPGDWKVYTYWDLYREVCQFANVLKSLGRLQGRPCDHLLAYGARTAHRHAGLRTHRCRPQRDLRRL